MKRKLRLSFLLYCDVYPSETASEMRGRDLISSFGNWLHRWKLGIANKMEADLNARLQSVGDFSPPDSLRALSCYCKNFIYWGWRGRSTALNSEKAHERDWLTVCVRWCEVSVFGSFVWKLSLTLVRKLSMMLNFHRNESKNSLVACCAPVDTQWLTEHVLHQVLFNVCGYCTPQWLASAPATAFTPYVTESAGSSR